MKSDVIYILWTNTRDDIPESKKWSPNHFVPLLPFTHDCRNDVNNNENNLKENVNNNKNTDINGENYGEKCENNSENIDSKDDSKKTYFSDLGDKSEKNGDVDKNSRDRRK
ncbi:hypothetical protein DPMN_061160 [Dreissena polymorpha]|uniref:Uncharacterized protein n=1 Tax=Dreissena polymorpha TaxID=45954 RepID=A0A9D4C731_DREPO|nr:hypothetical protein DPMN_061160 [Dreissena polymorpha]